MSRWLLQLLTNFAVACFSVTSIIGTEDVVFHMLSQHLYIVFWERFLTKCSSSLLPVLVKDLAVFDPLLLLSPVEPKSQELNCLVAACGRV